MGQANARINADRDKTQSGTRSKTRSQVEVFTANPQCLYIYDDRSKSRRSNLIGSAIV